MKNLKCAICDDDEFTLNIVSAALVDCFQTYDIKLVMDKYNSSVDFSKRINTENYQIVFLDIDMPEINGIDLGIKLKQVKDRTAIIFVSNYEGRVFDAFKAQPFGFVRKSNFLNDIKEVVKLYVEYSERSVGEEAIDLKCGAVNRRVSVADIVYIEGQRDQQIVHLHSGEQITIRYRMKEFEEQLKSKGIIRCHHGYLVNYRYIKNFDSSQIELQDGTIIPIARGKKDSFTLEYARLSRKDNSILF